MASLKQLESNLLFGHGQNSEQPDERLNSIAPAMYLAMLKSQEVHEEHKVMRHLKESHLSQRIFTFAAVLDIHVLVTQR